ncbi:mannose-ethanolamine phosphotransferase gpi13 [Batrachochytrium dendrobatidis]|nr:mannose-ethanolamine phosphotransferase gpi13 [Batrachochytrium dendrobatidis]
MTDTSIKTGNRHNNKGDGIKNRKPVPDVNSNTRYPSEPFQRSTRLNSKDATTPGTQIRQLVVLLIVLLGTHAAGLFLFKEGYLLTRLELEQTSTCQSHSPWTARVDSTSGSNTSIPSSSNDHTNDDAFRSTRQLESCWPKPRYERALLILIDALRFDFIAYDESLKPSETPHYINKMPTIHHLLKTQPTHALLFRGLADPPTTTLQRLMALMTGALPTLVDAGSNFASTAIKEDNFIRHLQAYAAQGILNKTVMTMGDDTWEGLFPNMLNETFSYPSFDVWDLHTVDLAVKRHLFPILDATMKANSNSKSKAQDWKSDDHDKWTSWGLLIAHFLGVDHAGHRYGPGHPAMGDKLVEMDQMLQRVIDIVDENTLVIVMGDHGMDNKGDHGGDSDNELDAAMFLYSKVPLMDADGGDTSSSDDKTVNTEPYRVLYDAISQVDQAGLEGSHPFGYWQGHRCISQIDFVSTVSMLMGVPIPFGNLGTVIPEVFFWSGDYLTDQDSSDSFLSTQMRNTRSWWNGLVGSDKGNASAAQESASQHSEYKIQPLEHLLAVMRANAQQIHAYIAAYGERRKDAQTSFADTLHMFTKAESLFSDLSTFQDMSKNPKEYQQNLIACYVAYTKYTRSTLIIARKIWSRFESVLMIMGVVIILMSILTTCALVAQLIGCNFSGDVFVAIKLGKLFGSFIVFGLIGFGSFIRAATHPEEDPMTLIIHRGHEILFFGMIGLIVSLAWQIYHLPVSQTVALADSSKKQFSKLGLHSNSGILSNQLVPGIVAIVLCIMYAGCAGSDSFTIFEDHVLLHFLQFYSITSTLWILVSQKIDYSTRRLLVIRSFVGFVLIRAIHGSTICRPDQGPFCVPTFNASSTSSITAYHTPIILFGVVIAVIWVFQYILERERAAVNGSSPGLAADSIYCSVTVFSTYIFPISVALSYIYWLFDTIEAHNSFIHPAMQSVKYYIAGAFWCTIPLSLWYICIWPWITSRSFHAPTLSKGDFTNTASENAVNRDQPTQQSLTNASGQLYLCFAAFVYVHLGFFQKPMGGVVFGLGFVQILCLADTTAVWRYAEQVQLKRAPVKPKLDADVFDKSIQTHQTMVDCDKEMVPNHNFYGLYLLHMVMLLLWSQKLFFSTGHQNALPTIQYEVGFVGLSKVNWILSPFFIGLNTFGGSILSAASVPLFVLLGQHTKDASLEKRQFTLKRIAFQLVFVTVVYFGVMSALELASATAFAGWFQKHSQAWRVWGPKFIFFSMSHVGACVMGILGLIYISYIGLIN